MALWSTWNRITRRQAAHLGSRRTPARRRPIHRLCLEALEDRCLLSSYTVTDLGTLGGPTSYAAGINNAGEVVGNADTRQYVVSGFTHHEIEYLDSAFLWKPSVPNGTKGSMTDLDSLFIGLAPFAKGINGPGQVVGEDFWAVNGAPFLHATLWTPAAPNGTSGGAVDLGTLGSRESVALAIKGSGQVVGQADTTSGAAAAFLWTPSAPNGTSGTMAALPTLAGAPAQFAYGINDSGQVVGIAGSAAFLYSGGKMIDLGSLAGSSGHIGAYAINAGGQVVGSSDMSSGPPPRLPLDPHDA